MRVAILSVVSCAGLAACGQTEGTHDWLVGGSIFDCNGKYERVLTERGKELLRTSGSSRFEVVRDPQTRQLRVNGRPFGGSSGVDVKCSTEKIDSVGLSRCHSESAEQGSDRLLILSSRDQTELVRGNERVPETDITVTHALKCRDASAADA